MSAASSATPSGAGLSFFKPSIARVTMPFLLPSFAGRSNSTTGTFTLTRWAAICAPITPAPRTATLRTWNRLMVAPEKSLDAQPGLRAVERPDVAAHLQVLAAFDGLQPRLVGLAVVRIEDLAAGPDVLVVDILLDVADDRQADDGLVLAIVAALVALRVRLRRVE